MADIDIERKRSMKAGSPWPWIIGLVVLALVAWGIWEWMSTDEQPIAVEAPREMPATEPMTPAPAATAGQQLQMWARDSIPQMATGTEMQIVQQGMQRVTSALQQLSRSTATTQPQAQDTAAPGTTPPNQTMPPTPTQPSGAMDQQIQQLQQQTQQLSGMDANSPEAAGRTREVFMSAVQVLEGLSQTPQLQQANMTSQVNAARSAAEAVNANQPLTQQRQALQRYFESMGAAIARAEQHVGTGQATQQGQTPPRSY